MTDALPTRGRLAGIDYGSKRIGIALSDYQQQLSSPLASYERRDQQGDARHFQRLVREEEICGFVVGLPLHTSGHESAKSYEARQFGAWLHQITGLPVAFADERYTSVEAEQILGQAGLTKKRRRARIDMLAAQIMLAGFLESDRSGASLEEGIGD